MHGLLGVVLGVSVAVAVSACTAGGGAAKTSPTDSVASVPPPSVSTAPSPTVTPAVTVDAIVVRPNGLDFVDGAATVSFLAYTEPASVFVPALERVLHAKAVRKDYASTDPRIAASTSYDWTGFSVGDVHLKVGGPGPEPNGHPTLSVIASEPLAAGTLPLRTIQGIKGGDSIVSAATVLGVTPSSSTFFAEPAESGQVLGPSRVPGYADAAAVGVMQDTSSAKTVVIAAPYNFGDGHDI